jgi:hypothetical protein
MAAVTGLASSVGIRAACDVLKLPRDTFQHAPFVRRNVKPSWLISTKNGFRIAPQPLCMRRCSMKGIITARFAPCIAS